MGKKQSNTKPNKKYNTARGSVNFTCTSVTHQSKHRREVLQGYSTNTISKGTSLPLKELQSWAGNPERWSPTLSSAWKSQQWLQTWTCCHEGKAKKSLWLKTLKDLKPPAHPLADPDEQTFAAAMGRYHKVHGHHSPWVIQVINTARKNLTI